MSETVYKPSLLCRLIGHKWWMERICEDLRQTGLPFRTMERVDITHCDRCGVPNPRMIRKVIY